LHFIELKDRFINCSDSEKTVVSIFGVERIANAKDANCFGKSGGNVTFGTESIAKGERR
jgi:hypothetical protein